MDHNTLILGLVNAAVTLIVHYMSNRKIKQTQAQIDGVAAAAVTVTKDGEYVVGTERARARIERDQTNKV